jgi:hypothetical protein
MVFIRKLAKESKLEANRRWDNQFRTIDALPNGDQSLCDIVHTTGQIKRDIRVNGDQHSQAGRRSPP